MANHIHSPLEVAKGKNTHSEQPSHKQEGLVSTTMVTKKEHEEQEKDHHRGAMKLVVRTSYWGRVLKGKLRRNLQDGRKSYRVITCQAVLHVEGQYWGCCPHHGKRVLELQEQHFMDHYPHDWDLYMVGSSVAMNYTVHSFFLLPRCQNAIDINAQLCQSGWVYVGPVRASMARMDLSHLLHNTLQMNEQHGGFRYHHAHLEIMIDELHDHESPKVRKNNNANNDKSRPQTNRESVLRAGDEAGGGSNKHRGGGGGGSARPAIQTTGSNDTTLCTEGTHTSSSASTMTAPPHGTTTTADMILSSAGGEFAPPPGSGGGPQLRFIPAAATHASGFQQQQHQQQDQGQHHHGTDTTTMVVDPYMTAPHHFQQGYSSSQFPMYPGLYSNNSNTMMDHHSMMQQQQVLHQYVSPSSPATQCYFLPEQQQQYDLHHHHGHHAHNSSNAAAAAATLEEQQYYGQPSIGFTTAANL